MGFKNKKDASRNSFLACMKYSLSRRCFDLSLLVESHHISPRRSFLHRSTVRIIAAMLISTSSSVVAQEQTLIRIATCPLRCVELHQQVPSSWMALTHSAVSASLPNETSTWLRTTSFKTAYQAAASSSANFAAC